MPRSIYAKPIHLKYGFELSISYLVFGDAGDQDTALLSVLIHILGET